MGGVIHAVEDGTGMNVGQVLGALTSVVKHAYTDPIQAVTPHGTYTFEIVAVEKENGQPVTLRLQEVP